ncbi:hypothetical protein AV530_016222 [Patagioenas fasciata monilis]|uniref:Uncharacterized protein n=1 Tax=Patagioenas fasciata monilis TaxID=372326 RepID=A0A1V4JWK1_PATFA|nr:hypothetical protein AV530_016222 [Patagioenas fasciata monilis]
MNEAMLSEGISLELCPADASQWLICKISLWPSCTGTDVHEKGLTQIPYPRGRAPGLSADMLPCTVSTVWCVLQYSWCLHGPYYFHGRTSGNPEFGVTENLKVKQLQTDRMKTFEILLHHASRSLQKSKGKMNQS